MSEGVRPDHPFDAAAFRRVLGHYPTGVCVITAHKPGYPPVGMVVGSFTSASLDPPLVAFLTDRESTSWPQIADAGMFCVNVLASDQRDLCTRFSARGGDKFAGLDFRTSEACAPILPGVVAWFDCSLHAVLEAGDHSIVLGRVRAMEVERPHQPLIFFRGAFGGFAGPDEAG